MLSIINFHLPIQKPLKSSAHLKGLILCAALVSFAPDTQAMGTETHFDLVPFKAIYNSYYIPDITLNLTTPSIKQISVVSIIEQGDRILDEAIVVRGYEVDAKSLSQAKITSQKLDAKSQGVQIKFPSPHEKPLEKGVYAQRVEVTVWHAELDVPVVQSTARFFHVTEDGMREIDSTTYSNVIEPLHTITDENGNKEAVYYGSPITKTVKLPERLVFDRQETPEKFEPGYSDFSETQEP